MRAGGALQMHHAQVRAQCTQEFAGGVFGGREVHFPGLLRRQHPGGQAGSLPVKFRHLGQGLAELVEWIHEVRAFRWRAPKGGSNSAARRESASAATSSPTSRRATSSTPPSSNRFTMMPSSHRATM